MHDAQENVTGLLNCGCISGYYRGFEKNLSRAEAIEAQIKQQWDWIRLFENQDRPQIEIDHKLELIYKLEALR